MPARRDKSVLRRTTTKSDRILRCLTRSNLTADSGQVGKGRSTATPDVLRFGGRPRQARRNSAARVTQERANRNTMRENPLVAGACKSCVENQRCYASLTEMPVIEKPDRDEEQLDTIPSSTSYSTADCVQNIMFPNESPPGKEVNHQDHKNGDTSQSVQLAQVIATASLRRNSETPTGS